MAGLGLRARFERSYVVEPTRDLLGARFDRLDRVLGERTVLVVTTPTVDDLYGPTLRARLADRQRPTAFEVLRVDEQTKDFEAVLRVCAAADRHGLMRRDPIVAFGGGICCDVVTVAAGLVRRGTPYVTMPTTLVGQIDAGIGLKGAVNFNGRKSYLGAFLAPEHVIFDTAWLGTLSRRDVRCGLSELVKIALIRDAELYSVVSEKGPELVRAGFGAVDPDWEAVIHRSASLMLEELEPNCFEDQTFERAVDFGHTFSPAFEEASSHRLDHGEAVALDMLLSAFIAEALAVSDDIARPIMRTLSNLGLPIWDPVCSVPNVMAALDGATAHRDGALNLVVPVEPGRSVFVREVDVVSPAVVERALADMLAATSEHGSGSALREPLEATGTRGASDG